MRPLKLKMKAFGPYADVEIIDFNQLNGRNLFLITGPTGSGKTTIFDAISFAMYGEANGTERSVESFRSQFAKDDVLSDVELDFELKGIKYHIHRIPKQQKLKARGEGYTEQKPEATLTIHGEEGEKVISGVTNVNQKIEEIIGINYEQFRQIMMIPQGEFKKFLIADSQDREKVLQKLFDTKMYNDIQTRLDIQEKELYNEIKSQTVRRNEHVNRIKYNPEDRLATLINSDDRNVVEILVETKKSIHSDSEKVEHIAGQIAEKEQYNNDLIEKIELTRNNNKLLEEKANLSSKINEGEAKASEIDLINEEIKKAENALRIVPIENILKQRELELVSKENEYIEVEKTEQSLIPKFKKAEEKYNLQISDSELKQRESTLEELTKLKEYKLKVEKIEEQLETVKSYQKSFDELEQNLNLSNQDIETMERRLESIRSTFDEAKDDAIKLEKVNNELEKLTELEKKITDAVDVSATMDEIVESNKTTKLQLDELTKKLKRENEKYENYKKEFFQNQAAIIAERLSDNDVCPVCGSKDHPELAKLPESIPTEKELNRLEGICKEIQQEHNRVNNILTKDETRLIQKYEEYRKYLVNLSDFIVVDIDNIDRKKIGEQLYEKQRLLEENKRDLIIEQRRLFDTDKILKKYETDINTISAELSKKKEYVKEIEANYHEVNQKLVEQKSKLEGIYDDVPKEYRKLGSLKITISNKEAVYNDMKRAYESSISEYQKIKEELAILTSRKEQLKEYVSDCRDSYNGAKSNFELEITSASFNDEAEYLSSKSDADRVESLKQIVEDYNKDMHLLRKQYIEISEKTKGLVKQDIIEFEEKIKLNLTEKQLLIDEKNELNNKINNNSETVENIESVSKQIFNKEEKYKTIGHLAKVAKGDNKARMTFERYVLAAFLEDIINAANIRLKKMTNGRYLLSRTEELQRKNKQSGLELEVYDNYTGRSRHVKTLSGGESFKASLSMALGLSDVVQSYAGGVRLDTMFIDEGFGSLDAESLDNAILTLIDLQKSGRLVGVISHVSELKERLDARLEVMSTNTGSRTRFIVS